jgi:cytochrome P450
MAAKVDDRRIPDHVPDHLVLDFDHVKGPEIQQFPPTALEGMRSRRVFYTLAHGGYWVLTRNEDIRHAFQDAESFGQSPGGAIPLVPFARRNIPVALDPPQHKPWRRLLLPLFSPRHIAAQQPMLRASAKARLAEIAPRGRCDFFAEYALVLPVARFCHQLGLPAERVGTFLELGSELIYGTAQIAVKQGHEAAAEHRLRYGREIEAVVEEVIARRKRERGDDIVSQLLDASFDGEPLAVEQILDIVTFLFFAGTDSSSIAIAFAVYYLAQNPKDRREIVKRPEILPSAVEELLRYGSVHYIPRVVRRDLEFAGVQMRKGDLVALSTSAAGRDPGIFDHPETVDLERSSNRHLAFGAGAHRCLGAHMASQEMVIALEEFHKVIPDYSLDPEAEISFEIAAGKSRPRTVPLVYPAS